MNTSTHHPVAESRFPDRGREGHTLIEVLTAVVVLALMLVLMFEVIDGIFRVTRNQNRSMESVAIGRRLLDVMTSDLRNGAFSRNATLLSPSSPGTNIFALLVNRRGTNSGTPARFLAVSYSLNNSNQVFRSYGSVGFGSTNLLIASISNPVSVCLPLANGVLALQARAVTVAADYPLSGATSSNWATTGSYNGCAVPAGYNALITDSSATDQGLTNGTRAIEIWVAVAGEQDYDLLSRLGKLPSLANSLANATNPSSWRSQVDAQLIPAELKSGIRIQKKTIPLP